MARLLAYDPTRGGTVPIDQARAIAYVIDQDTGKRYSTRAEAEAATRTTAATKSTIDPYYVRDPLTGLSPAQVEANKAVEEAAAAAGMKVTPGATGPKATAARVSTTPIATTTQKTTPTVTTPTAVTPTVSSVKTYTAPDGRIFTDLNAYNAYLAQTEAEAKRRAGQSAFDLLKSQFALYGLEGLVADVEKYVKDGLSQAEFTLRLRTESDAYKKRFAANEQRIKSGLRALSEAEYIGLEDQYQNVMRQYGLPESYYKRGDMGTQQGFEKFIGGDVSAAELEDRIQTAQNRVINAAPEISQALKQFYPDITNGDILAYALDPQQAITNIKRKVTAAEIGAGALQAGLQTGLTRAEELQRYGVTGEAARTGYGVIAGGLERGRQLSQIYQQPEYTQTTAEQEVFGLPSATEAAKQRKRLSKLEEATFGGTTGMTGGALARERAGQF